MPRPTDLTLLFAGMFASAALAGAPSTQPRVPPRQWSAAELSPAARSRAKNYFRPGWFLVDGHWARSQGTVDLPDLFTLVENDGRLNLWADPAPAFDPLLRNARVSLVELHGSNYPWKMSAAGRVWNDTRSAGSQHLLLTAATDDVRIDGQFRLTKIEITPDQQVIQAAVVEAHQPTSVILVLGRDFIECAAGPFHAAPTTLVRSTSARQLLLDRPTETRRYAVPLLALVNHGSNPLAPGAADVYRAFPDLPVDPRMDATIQAMLPDLSAADPAVRRRASAELQSLGRRGVQAAMRMNVSKLPFEAADRIAAFIHSNSHDDRAADALRRDSGFILDCLSDPDANVRAEAGKLPER